MQFGTIPGIDKPVARVIQGGTMIGSELDRERSFELLDAVFEAGGTTIDTAHVYSGGNSERVIGEWASQRGLRDQLVIITKGAAHSEDRRRMTPFDIASDLHDSLARLQTDHVELYLLHRDDPEAAFEPIVEALNQQVEAGRIRAFGASNWSPQRIEAANRYAEQHRLRPFAASSPQFSLGDQLEEPWPECLSISGAAGVAARKWYAERKLPLLAYSPLASGFYSGRFRRDNLDGLTRELDQIGARAYASEANFQRLDRAAELAEQQGLTVAQIAVAYVMNSPMNVFAIIGSSTGERFRLAVEGAEVELTAEEIAWLEDGD